MPTDVMNDTLVEALSRIDASAHFTGGECEVSEFDDYKYVDSGDYDDNGNN